VFTAWVENSSDNIWNRLVGQRDLAIFWAVSSSAGGARHDQPIFYIRDSNDRCGATTAFQAPTNYTALLLCRIIAAVKVLTITNPESKTRHAIAVICGNSMLGEVEVAGTPTNHAVIPPPVDYPRRDQVLREFQALQCLISKNGTWNSGDSLLNPNFQQS
jgi:hypothetical protein